MKPTNVDRLASSWVTYYLDNEPYTLPENIDEAANKVYRLLQQRDGWVNWREAVAATYEAFKRTLARRRTHLELVAGMCSSLDEWYHHQTHDMEGNPY